MKFTNIIKTICFIVITATFCASCKNNDASFSHKPKYLLNGSYAGEDANGDYEYYLIDNTDTYAVGLKKSSKNKTSLGSFPTEYNNKQVTGIWRSGFHNSQATSISIPSGITVIDYEAFMESKITTITIPATVSEIGEAAFYSCKGLTKAVIQNSTSSSQESSACSCVQESGDDSGSSTSSNLQLIPAFCFFNCHELAEVVFPESIKKIGEEAFHNCRKLYSTLAFMSIEEIGYRAFQGCASLTKIYISSSFFAKDQNNNPIGVIGDKAFDACNSNLIFYLVGDEDDVEDWLDAPANANWNQKNALVAPGAQINPDTSSGTRYKYLLPGANAGARYTNDWIYTIDQNNEVDISAYIGPTQINGVAIKFITFPNDLPNGSGNYVRSIAKDALDTVKASLERIYLPKNLRRIEAGMFDGSYTNLKVVDDNTTCSTDEAAQQPLNGRIILNGLTDLEVIGNNAFVNMPHLGDIKKLYLPYSLKGVGANAFGSSSADGKHLKGVTDFKWDYDDTKSALKVIGKEAFYEIGRTDNSKSTTGGNVYQDYFDYSSNPVKPKFELTTLIIPRTFEHFGVSSTDITSFGLTGLQADGNDENFGIAAFAGSPLLSKVVFKGSKLSTVQSNPGSSYDETDTFNLALASKTFIMNESLRTVVFEERVNKHIAFHTKGGKASEAVIGWSSGKSNNDFNGNPALQTLVLPNKYTTLQIQNYAFQCNSRGVIYYSAANNNGKVKGNTEANMYNIVVNPTTNGNKSLSADWRTIGKDNSSIGYNFANQNTFGINQQMPYYDSILYEDPDLDDVIVGYGNTNIYIEKDKCAFVTNGSTDATMTNYLYDRYDASFSGTAKVPAKVGDNNLKVTKIGNSAFSAAYCDGKNGNYKNDNTHKELTAVKIPSTVKTIGEYAFMRAYGVTSLSSYTVDSGGNETDNDTYVMPSALTSIGKHAFAFCNIKKFLKIPDNCVFYENSNINDIETTNTTSVFSNNFSLRQITFGTSGATYNAKYKTTTYVHTGSEDNGQNYTSALYSTSFVTKNKNRLLLVLNRDTGSDRLTQSEDLAIMTKDGNDYNEFNGRYGYSGQTPTVTNYLYGAFKMCYWIESLIVGTSNNTLDQPLISGIYNGTNNVGEIVYLGKKYDFDDYVTELEAVSFGDATTIATPPYSFAGCEKLERIKLPRVEGATIPAGLFASVSNSNVVFEVPSDNTGINFTECAPGVLDLRYTGYAGIDKEAFKGTGIKQVIAPEPFDGVTPNTFTIEEDAFANCSQLTSVDFQYVTGRVVLNGAFKGATISSTLFNFGSAALIEFGKEAFKGCTISDNTFSFPAKTAVIGESCFEGCSTLETVTADAVLTNLEKVVVDGGTHQDRNEIVDQEIKADQVTINNQATIVDDRGGFTQIGNYAFYLCNNLKNFDFTKFNGIERIGHYAFSMCNKYDGVKVSPASGSNWPNNSNKACICPNGNVNLPASITNLGVGVFSSSMIVNVTINSSEMRFERGKDFTIDERAQINRGGHQFEYCPELLTVMFMDSDCEWNTPYINKSSGNTQAQDNFFSWCNKLQRVYMTSDFEISHWADQSNSGANNLRPDSMVWKCPGAMRFYLYHTLDDWNGSAVCRYWHNTDNGYDNLIFYVSNSSELLSFANNVYTLKNLPKTDQPFWTIINGNVVDLGRITSVDSSTGVVTFFNGYTLSGSTFTAP